MKIIKHSREIPGTAAGLLLGLDLDSTLEISNSFGLPTSSEGEDKLIKSSGGDCIVVLSVCTNLPLRSKQADVMKQPCYEY